MGRCATQHRRRRPRRWVVSRRRQALVGAGRDGTCINQCSGRACASGSVAHAPASARASAEPPSLRCCHQPGSSRSFGATAVSSGLAGWRPVEASCPPVARVPRQAAQHAFAPAPWCSGSGGGQPRPLAAWAGLVRSPRASRRRAATSLFLGACISLSLAQSESRRVVGIVSLELVTTRISHQPC